MALEDPHTDRKPLRIVCGNTVDWEALAEDGRVVYSGERRWRRYRLSDAEHKGQMAGSSS